MITTRSFFLPLAAIALPLMAALPDPVKTTGGLLSGVPGADPGIHVFKGIPFAAPPVGDARWRAPQPPAPWQGVRKVSDFSASCIQNTVEERKPWTYEFMTHNQVSEDCLYLNVWTPAKSPSAKLPVFFWIYGGGYNEGSAAVPAYDGERLAGRGVVVVTINYRVGALGFLAHPELAEKGASGNYGILDQIAALQWVKQNISAFGGDPGRVTIAGQSAGAGSVHVLTASPLAKGLFHRAIAQSGSGIVGNASMLRVAEAEKQGVQFAESKRARNMQQLRALPWKDVLARASGGPGFAFRPIIDGWVLPADVTKIILAGKHHDVPVLTGLTADEASSQATYGTVPLEEFRKQVQERFGDLAATFWKLYPSRDQAGAGMAQKASSRDRGLVSMYLWAAQRARTSKTPVYTYYWTHPEPGPDSARFGAFHTSEVPYVLNTLHKSQRPWTEKDHALAETMGAYWVNFMTTGNPNGKGLPTWPVFRAQDPVTMEIGEKTAPRPVAEPAKIELYRTHLTSAAPR